ncbi:hypothetical protein GIY23_04750 [Allosaccharopolyspora coralli]|uniref:Uncharacterized protein n=1 Tax=Allosaccharopolyspora coralli TaxID=2665642 RepID=A0A5Q3Q2W5_9PSEU|nr:hypothetical protein [Allosaccharopolyspora coralli]QGK68938.1 hypothetical protein GIY23_04750 [Allosaccharopolyspora coralli]
MISTQMLVTPGHPLTGGIELPYAPAGPNAAATRRRAGFAVPTVIIPDDRRSVLERSP